MGVRVSTYSAEVEQVTTPSGPSSECTLDSHVMAEYWDVSGPDMDREAFQHEGAIFEVVSASQIGNMVVATGRWTFPEERYPDWQMPSCRPPTCCISATARSGDKSVT